MRRISDIREAKEDVRRLRQVVRVLFEAGFEEQLQQADLCRLVPVPRRFVCAVKPAPFSAPTLARRLRAAFEELGPTFIKLGQMLSVRPDLVGEDTAAEFVGLQERVAPVPYAEVLAAVERSLGGPWTRHFRSIAKTPLASASVAQVHRAVTAEGRRIVIKVRRPGIKEEVVRDLHLVALLTRLLERYVSASRPFQPVSIAREFSEWTTRELDFLVEAGHIERFRNDFADEPRMRVPAVHWELTREDLLAMDEVVGMRIDDAAGLKRKKVSRPKTARLLMESFLRQFFVTGFFHGDPHPGNLLVTAGGSLALLDFGIMGSLNRRLREELVSAFLAYLRHDVEAYVKHVLDMAAVAPGADVRGFAREVRDILDAVIYRPATRKGIPTAFYRIVVSGGRFGVRFPTDLALLAKALLTVEGVVRTLDPKIDIEAALEPLFARLERDRLDPRLWLPDLRDEAFETARSLSHLPARTEGLLRRVEEGRLSVRLDLEELKGMLAEFDRENDLRVLAIVATGTLLSSALLLAQPGALPGGATFGKIGLVVSALLLAGTFLEARKKPA